MKNALFVICLLGVALSISACAPARKVVPLSPPTVGDSIESALESGLVSPPNQEDPRRSSLIYTAYQSLGIQYKWGGESPENGFDCSGLMQYAYKVTGIDIPRTVVQQIEATYEIFEHELKPGDLAFYKTGRYDRHVGIYIGNGEFIHAGSGSGKVRMQRIDSPYWQRRLIRYGRVPLDVVANEYPTAQSVTY